MKSLVGTKGLGSQPTQPIPTRPVLRGDGRLSHHQTHSANNPSSPWALKTGLDALNPFLTDLARFMYRLINRGEIPTHNGTVDLLPENN